MKIDYVVVGSNKDPMYLDFWPIISKVWKEVFNITPVLGLICNESVDFQEDKFGLIKKFKTVDGIESGFQSQIVRFSLINHLSGIILLSDIDMLPISKNYFVEQLKEWDSSKFFR
jgi:hypothetical protein